MTDVKNAYETKVTSHVADGVSTKRSVSCAPSPKSWLPNTAGAFQGDRSLFQSST